MITKQHDPARLYAIFALSLTAACVSGTKIDFEKIEATSEHLHVQTDKIWVNKTIQVCWENSGFDEEKEWTRQAVESSWEAASSIDFTGWKDCVSGARGIHVFFADGRGYSALGTDLDGVTANGLEWDKGGTGMRLNAWVTQLCVAGVSRDRCVRSTAVHEFGHALGFLHEQDRDDRAEDCDGSTVDGGTKVGDWDIDSVMNYCNPVRNGDSTLSATDIVGLQRYYGAPPVYRRSWTPPVTLASRDGVGLEALGLRTSTGNILQKSVSTGSLTSGGFFVSISSNTTSSPMAPITAVTRTTGQVDYFVAGNDGKIYTNRRKPDGALATTYNWFPISNANTTHPGAQVAAVARGGGLLDAFVVGTDGRIYWSASPSATEWGPWVPISPRYAAPPGGSISAVALDANSIDVFVAGKAGRVYVQAWRAGLGWVWNTGRALHAISPEGSAVPGSPIAALARTAWELDLFKVGNDGRVYSATWRPATGWSGFGGWAALSPRDTSVAGAPVTAIARSADAMDLFVTGADGVVYTAWWNRGKPWSAGSSTGWKPISTRNTAGPGSAVGAVARGPLRIDLAVVGTDGAAYSSHWKAGWDWTGINGWWPITGAQSIYR